MVLPTDTELTNKLNSLEEKRKAITDALATKLTSDVAQLTTSISSIDTSLTQRIGTLSAAFNNLNDDVAAVETDTTTNTSDIGDLESKVSQLETDVPALQRAVKAINDAAHGASISDLTTALNQLQQKIDTEITPKLAEISTLQTALAGKVDDTDFQPVKNKANANETKITNLTTTVGGKVNDVDFQPVKRQTETNKTQITSLGELLAAVLQLPPGGDPNDILSKTPTGYAWVPPPQGVNLGNYYTKEEVDSRPLDGSRLRGRSVPAGKLAAGSVDTLALSTGILQRLIPTGGQQGQILEKTTDPENPTRWINAPSGGSGTTIANTAALHSLLADLAFTKINFISNALHAKITATPATVTDSELLEAYNSFADLHVRSYERLTSGADAGKYRVVLSVSQGQFEAGTPSSHFLIFLGKKFGSTATESIRIDHLLTIHPQDGVEYDLEPFFSVRGTNRSENIRTLKYVFEHR